MTELERTAPVLGTVLSDSTLLRHSECDFDKMTTISTDSR